MSSEEALLDIIASWHDGQAKYIPNAMSEKLALRSRSFLAIFHVFGQFSKFSEAFGPVRMRSDVFGCNRMHFGALGSVPTLLEIFGFFQFLLDDLGDSWSFWGLGGLLLQTF